MLICFLITSIVKYQHASIFAFKQALLLSSFDVKMNNLIIRRKKTFQTQKSKTMNLIRLFIRHNIEFVKFKTFDNANIYESR